jgi:DNA repair protein RadC
LYYSFSRHIFSIDAKNEIAKQLINLYNYITMKIHDLPSHLRPREKLIAKGASNLKEKELMAILLRTGNKKMNVIELAEQVLKKFSTKQLANLNYEQLITIQGIESSKACTFLAAMELAKRALDLQDNQLPTIFTPTDVILHVHEVRSKKKEHFIALFLNARNQLLQKEIISVGTLTSSLVHPREVFEPALRISSAAIILVHNHPSGETTPSEQDINVTKRLVEVGNLVGIDIIDHVIVSATGHSSMSELGIIK